jgi:phosphatidylserine/phosphatidylglycerophosphate/cardiolipin synthase-like enzyme
MMRPLQAFALATLVLLGAPLTAAAQERLCDTQFEDCRAPLLELIRNETVGIDVAFWFMEDFRYVAELINRKNAGVPVRVLVDTRANASKRLNEDMLNYMRDAGIPMREKFTGDILHFKMMLFHGQNKVEFSKANFTDPSCAELELFR